MPYSTKRTAPFGAAVAFLTCALPLMMAATALAQTQNGKLPAAVSAPQTSLVHLASADAPTLASALRAISRQARVAFVAEGKAFRARNSAAPLAPVAEKWPVEGMPLSEAVAKIAAAYDYDAARTGDVFLLRKRYTNADDIPDITAEELRLSLRDASQAASALPAPTVPPADIMAVKDPFAWEFYQTLTPAQKQKLTDPAHFLNVSDLNANQQKMMREFVQSRFVQNAVDGVKKAYAAVQASNQKSTTFHWADKTNPSARVLGIDVRPLGQPSQGEFYPFAPGGWTRFRFGNQNLVSYSKTDVVPPDASAPRPSDYAPSRAPLPPPAETGPDDFTLQTLAERLSQKAGNTYTPSAELAAKSVLVVGLENSALHEALWRAAGDVYGLRAVRTENKGPLLLVRPRARIAKTFAELNAAVFGSFPAPLVRLQKGTLATAIAEQTKLYTSGAKTLSSFGLDADVDRSMMRAFGRVQALEAIKAAFFRRLRILLEPRFAQDREARVSYGSLSSAEHDLWTLALVVDCLENVSRLEGEGVPATMTNFDKGWVHGFTMGGYTPTSPPKRIVISFLATGEGQTSATVGNVPPPDAP